MQFYISPLLNSIEQLSYESIYNHFKDNYYQQLFVKKINDSLLLIHNSFENHNPTNSNIYNECRSIVIELTDNGHKIISYSHDNINYLKATDYLPIPNDSYEESYEGTLISVFKVDNKWHFTTARCTDFNNSYFYNKDRTFGLLFDECLGGMSRDEFTDLLEPNNCYYFVIVHHENKYVIDYTERFGEEYKKLIHVFTRNKETQELVDNSLDMFEKPLHFNNYEDAIVFLNSDIKSEGIIVKRYVEETQKTSLMKIHSDSYWIQKQQNPNYPNRWFCYLDIYKTNNPDFKITDYQTKKNIVETLQYQTKSVDITGMIYVLFKGTAETLFNLVMHFTRFNFETKTYSKINGEDYEIIKNLKYGALRKQITILQTLINKQVLKTSVHLISHLRRYVSVQDFVGLLGAINLLIKDTNIIKTTDRYYIAYVNMYLEQLDN